MKSKKFNIINTKLEEEVYVAKRAYQITISNRVFFFVYDENDEFRGIVLDGDNYSYAYRMIETKNYFKTRKEHLLKCRDRRNMKVIFQKSAGTSSSNGESSVVYIPTSWLKDMGITKENREVELLFNGENILVRKKPVSDSSDTGDKKD